MAVRYKRDQVLIDNLDNYKNEIPKLLGLDKNNNSAMLNTDIIFDVKTEVETKVPKSWVDKDISSDQINDDKIPTMRAIKDYVGSSISGSTITVTGPLKKDNNVISITESNGSTNGYLSSTDWNRFNGKEANTASSLGGTSLVGNKVGIDLKFKGLNAGTNITFDTTNSNYITINSTNSGLGSVDGGSSTSVIGGTCNTAANTAGKTVTISNYTLKAGDLIAIKYTSGNTANSATLNINSTGVKNILLGGQQPTGTSGTGGHYIGPNGVVVYYYDGSSYHQLGSNDITDADTNTGEANTATSLGGTSIVGNKVGVDLKFKGLTAGNGIELVNNTNDITIKLNNNFNNNNALTMAQIFDNPNNFNGTWVNLLQRPEWEWVRFDYFLPGSGSLRGSVIYIYDNSHMFPNGDIYLQSPAHGLIIRFKCPGYNFYNYESLSYGRYLSGEPPERIVELGFLDKKLPNRIVVSSTQILIPTSEYGYFGIDTE